MENQTKRLAEIRKQTREAVLYHLKEARAGQSELILKEVWENCDKETTDELDASDAELDVIIAAIESLPRLV